MRMKNIKNERIGRLIGILLVVILFPIILNNNKIIRVKKFSCKEYSFKYDTSWAIANQDRKSVELKHSKNGLINIQIKELEGNIKYQSINSIKEDLIASIQNQNKDYKLLAQESSVINKVNAYKLLFEKDNNQVLVIFMKQQNSLILYTYEADSDYFDILLDSALNIIYNFRLNIDVKYNTKLESINVTGNNYLGNDKVDKVKKYEIHSNNYSVYYNIPIEYKMTNYDSTKGTYKKDNRYIYTNIYNSNIYELITNKYTGIDAKVLSLKKSYKDVKYTVDKGLEDDSYIYQITYKYGNKKYEDIYMYYTLDNSHTFTVDIKSTNNEVSKELIDSIKIIKKEKYSKNITLNKVGNYYINELKQKIEFTNTDNEYYTVKLYTPINYTELDKTNNMYASRYFGYGYNEKTDKYNLNYSFEITNLCPKTVDEVKKYYSYANVSIKSDGIKKYNNNSYYKYNIKNGNKYINILVKPLNKDYKCIKFTFENNGNYVSNNVINALSKYDYKIEKEG